MKITPVLVVPAIEPVLPLWEALGFTRTTDVPHDDVLGFVILAGDGAEVMYQTEASVAADEARVLEGPKPLGATSLFVQVDDLDAIVAKLPQGTDIVVERRTTFYGSTETFIRDAAGNVIVFAQFAPA
ncbi:MAG TPA: VOC family protein [Thermoanaerobaculia bacterium]